MRARIVPLVLLVAGALAVAPPWGEDASRAQAAPRSLAARVETAIRKKRHKDVRFSLAVWDASTGSRVAYSLPEKLRRTASVMKVFTTAAALEALGPDHELATELRVTAAPIRGVVQGDLVLESLGDPGFSTHLAPDGVEAQVRAFARQVVQAGISRVEGALVVDSSAFPGPDRHPDWGWKGEHAWYMAPVTAVTLSDACVDIAVAPGPRVGAPGRLAMRPPNELIDLRNSVVTTKVRKEHALGFRRAPGNGPVTAWGKVWTRSTGYEASLAWVDPPELFADVLRRVLVEQGVTIAGETRILRGPPAAPWPRPADRPGQVVARHATTVADAVGVINRRSQNLWAELMLRHTGLMVEGDASFDGGARAVADVLELDPAHVRQADGSGLSRENVASVDAVGRVLVRMFDSPNRLAFMGSLARGGEPSGTLRKRFKGRRYAGRVLAKTGTLRDTSALAGYVLANEDRVLAFAILCEGVNWRARALQDAVVTALLDD